MATPATQSAPRNAPPGGVDPEVKVPKAVRDAAERAQKLFESSNGKAPSPAPAANGNDTITISDTPPAEPTPPATPPATPPQPATPQTPTPPPAAEPPAGETVPRADYNAMKGRFDKANANNIRLSEEVQSLRNLVMQMSTAPAPASPAQTPPELQAHSLLSEQEIADYGPEFLEVVGKKAQEIAGREIATLKAEIDKLSKGIQTTVQVSAQTARDQMITKMDEDLPEWRSMNTQPEFIEWLRLPDMYSGAIRGELLKTAFDQNNPARVLAFFKGFLSEEAATTPANPTPLAEPAPQKVPLATFAAPGRAKSAPATPPAEKPIITRAQVTQFYLDVAAGKYRGREAEKNQLEAMIFSATNEGRLR